MRLVTSARLRAVGILLIEVAGLVLLIYDRVSGDKQVRKATTKLLEKVDSL